MKIEDIVVKTIDNKDLIKFLSIELNKNEKLNIDAFAVFENKFGINISCGFWDIENAHLDSKIQPVINIECRIEKHKPDGSFTLRMDKPDFVKTITLDDYFKIATEVKLIDFIRYNYNPRIQGNQKLLMKYIEESYKECENEVNISLPKESNFLN